MNIYKFSGRDPSSDSGSWYVLILADCLATADVILKGFMGRNSTAHLLEKQPNIDILPCHDNAVLDFDLSGATS